jgi:hypothetical protein
LPEKDRPIVVLLAIRVVGTFAGQGWKDGGRRTAFHGRDKKEHYPDIKREKA